MDLINVTGLCFSYREKSVLSDISLSVGRGEILCLLGPNGSGKTTLLDCMLGLLKPNKGRILVCGEDTVSCPSSHLPRSMAYVPQNHESTFPYTVSDMVLMGRAAHLPFMGTPGSKDHERVNKALGHVGLSSLKDRPYTQLSGGERQRVMIARALVQDTPVIIMDEPTAHLDFRHEFIVLETIMDLVRKQKRSVVMATHFPNHAFYFENRDLSTRVALLSEGRLLQAGPPEEVLTRERIRDLYGIESTVISFESEGKTQNHVIPVKGVDP